MLLLLRSFFPRLFTDGEGDATFCFTLYFSCVSLRIFNLWERVSKVMIDDVREVLRGYERSAVDRVYERVYERVCTRVCLFPHL